MSRMLRSGALTHAEANIAMERARYNGEAARIGIDELERHARLTELGAAVLDTLRSYWAGSVAQ